MKDCIRNDEKSFNCRVKPAETKSELLGKAYVHWKSWQETYRGLVDDDYLNQLTREKCEEMAIKHPDCILVATIGDPSHARVVGFLRYGKSREKGSDISNTAEIYAIYVLQAYHGTGIAKQLLDEGLKLLKGFETVILWVLEGNERAIRFYEKHGFQLDGRTRIIQLGSERTILRMVKHVR